MTNSEFQINFASLINGAIRDGAAHKIVPASGKLPPFPGPPRN